MGVLPTDADRPREGATPEPTLEYGIFSDEGQIERGMHSLAEARERLSDGYSADDDCWVAACCHDHPDFEDGHCEECDSEDEDEEGEDEDDDEDDDDSRVSDDLGASDQARRS